MDTQGTLLFKKKITVTLAPHLKTSPDDSMSNEYYVCKMQYLEEGIDKYHKSVDSDSQFVLIPI